MIIITTTQKLYEIFKDKFGNVEAESLVNFIEMNLRESDGIYLEKLKAIQKKNKRMLRWLFVCYTLLMLAIIGLYFRN